ncbi:MAG: hypothetical protein HeimC2_33630 [Candidatus Heimdallarchaeota archaeon LC_2]|nr:MAG: hypothetical protein HeimC2_33630 [Candidatus Heimdallarchaeota archaeon LC_2]
MILKHKSIVFFKIKIIASVYIVFTELIGSYINNDPKEKKFSDDLIIHIENSINAGLPLYAVHGYCTDGGTAGAMIRFAVPEAGIIPLPYEILNNSDWRKLLENLNWVGIVDLEPFNKNRIDWYIDHHLSTVKKPINANKIRFDVNGDSGAWQLLLSSFLNPFPDKIVELAVMTRTTDTAGYITEPPTTSIDKLTDLDLTILEGIEGRKQNEQRIWLLDDAWGSVETLKDQLNLHNILASDGFIGLNKVLSRINKLRQFRAKGIEIADSLSINSDILIYSFKTDTIDKFGITRRLQTRGAKVVISLSKTANGYKISFRRNRELSENENKNIQLNEIAALLNGGGHAGASGAFSETYENALTLIKKWALQKNLTISENTIN